MSQSDKILNWLKSGNPLTHRDAQKLFGCDRLAARIKDLRYQGYNINTRMVGVKTRFGDDTQIALYSYSKGAQYDQE